MTDAQTPAEHTHPASTPTRASQRLARPDTGTETPGAPTGRQTGAESRQRHTADTITDDALDALYDRLEHAEDSHRRTQIELDHWQRVITPELRAALDRARQTAVGLMDDGDPYSHADLADVIRQTAAPEPDPEPAEPWAPPPPGDTREQLSDHLLPLLPTRDYLSTACDTGRALAEAIADHPERAAELNAWRRRMHQRCRRNHKFTGALCVCWCHRPDTRQP
jgi:hypothetical protein